MWGEGRHPKFRELLDTKLSPFLTSHAYQFWRQNDTVFDKNFYYRALQLGSRPAPRQLGPLARRRARLDGQNVRRDRPRRAAPTVERQDPPGPALVDPHQALLLEPGLPLERAWSVYLSLSRHELGR